MGLLFCQWMMKLWQRSPSDSERSAAWWVTNPGHTFLFLRGLQKIARRLCATPSRYQRRRSLQISRCNPVEMHFMMKRLMTRRLVLIAIQAALPAIPPTTATAAIIQAPAPEIAQEA